MPGTSTQGMLRDPRTLLEGVSIGILQYVPVGIAIGVVFYVIGRGHAVHDRWPDEGTTADRREMAASVTRN